MLRHTLLPALLIASPVLAQDGATVGSLDGTLDGVQTAYVILDGDSAETGWSEVENGVEVRLGAYPADGVATSDEAPLTMRLIADPAGRASELIEGEVTFMRDGETLTGTDDAIDLTISSLEISGDSLLLEGNIRVTMAEVETDVSVVSDHGVTLSGDIQATIIRDE